MRLHALAHSRAAQRSAAQRSGIRVLHRPVPAKLRGVGFGACESAVAVQLGEREGTGRAQHAEPSSASASAVAAESRLKPSSSRRDGAVLSLSGLSAPSLGSSAIAAHPPSSSLPKLNESSSGPPADASGSSPTRAQLPTRIRGCDGTGSPCDMLAYCDIDPPVRHGCPCATPQAAARPPQSAPTRTWTSCLCRTMPSPRLPRACTGRCFRAETGALAHAKARRRFPPA